jgi:endonuclease YncB( thermonuclease family)
LKKRLSGFVLVVVALIAVCTALFLGKARVVSLAHLDHPEHLTDERPGQNTAPLSDSSRQRTAASTPVRQIQPQIFAPPDVRDAARLERIAPRAPLTPPPVKEEAPVSNMIQARAVVALDGGHLVLGKQTIALAGIVPLELGAICRDANGANWPCGMAARTALRGYLRNRLVTCERDPALTETAKAVCSVGGRNIALWMVENGWARVEPTSPFFVAAQQAQDKGAGLNGLDPRMTIDDSLTKEMENNDTENHSP